MSIDTQERLERRVAELAVNDPEFAAARPDEAVSAAIEAAGRRLPKVAKAVLEGYSDRPALAQRAVELVKDPQTGRTSAKLLPWFDKVTYGELADRVDVLSRAFTNGADGMVTAGDLRLPHRGRRPPRGAADGPRTAGRASADHRNAERGPRARRWVARGPRRRARRGRPAGPADLHLGQHRRAQRRDVPAEQRRQDVEQVDQELDRAKCRVDHPELHADEPRHGPRQP